MKKIIDSCVKLMAKSNISYSDSQYIIKQIRVQLGLKPSKRSNGAVQRLSRDEYQDFINAAYNKSAKYGLMMQTLFETAMRVSEFCNLKAEHIFFNEFKIIVPLGKGEKRREIPIEKHLSRQLLNYLDGRKSGIVFRSRNTAQKRKMFEGFGVRRIQDIVKEIAQIAEIKSIKLTPHKLRHTRATFLNEDGMSIDDLKDFLGHYDSKTTLIYIKTANVRLVKNFHQLKGTYIL